MTEKVDNKELVVQVNWQPTATNCAAWTQLWEKLLAEPAETPRDSELEGIGYTHQDSGGKA